MEINLFCLHCSIAVMLISRFLLHLQEASRTDVELARSDGVLHVSADSSSIGSLNFVRAIGSVGASIVPSSEVED